MVKKFAAFASTFLLVSIFSLMAQPVLSFPLEAQAKPPPPSPQRVNVAVWFDGLTLGPGESKTWFEDNVAQNTVRSFTAVPNGFNGIDSFVANDMSIEVTNVFYILKGDLHATDGSGGQRTLQVNVTVRNRDLQHAIKFAIYKAEFK